MRERQMNECGTFCHVYLPSEIQTVIDLMTLLQLFTMTYLATSPQRLVRSAQPRGQAGGYMQGCAGVGRRKPNINALIGSPRNVED
jgi:hypothetical protein